MLTSLLVLASKVRTVIRAARRRLRFDEYKKVLLGQRVKGIWSMRSVMRLVLGPPAT